MRRVLMVVSALLLGGGGASAMGSCAGTVAATVLGDLPQPLVVGIDVFDNSPRNLRLADRFKAGLHDSGVTVVGKTSALLQLNASFSGGAAAAGTSAFSDFTDYSGGGVQRDYPDASQFGGGAAPSPQTLSMRIEMRPADSQRAVWVASLQCTVQTTDTGQLAYDMGTVIGPIVGRRSERIRF